MAIRRACANTFEGNLVAASNAQGVLFDVNTGANVYRGNHEVVEDAGAFDCDGDGEIDPNRISGVQFQAPRDTIPGPPPTAVPMQHGGLSLPARQKRRASSFTQRTRRRGERTRPLRETTSPPLLQRGEVVSR